MTIEPETKDHMQAIAEEILGQTGASALRALDVVVRNLGSHSYSFMPVAQFRQLVAGDIPEAMRIYWSEMLYRTHMAAAVSAIRNHRWLSGALAATESANFPAFAGCFRGFLESATDSKHTMMSVPLTLAQHSYVIGKAVIGQLDVLVINRELEDALIHFSHGRRVRKDEKAPASHQAKLASEYIRLFEEGMTGELKQCYAVLCEITHPAWLSVALYLSEEQSGTVYNLAASTDAEAISAFCERFADTIDMLVQVGISASLITLDVLNRLPLPSVHTAALRKLDLRGIPVWDKIEAAFKNPFVPTPNPQ